MFKACKKGLYIITALMAWMIVAPVSIYADASTGKVDLTLKYIGLGVGIQEGTAMVTVNGKTAAFKVRGTHLLGAGISVLHATGKVTGAKVLADIAGAYEVTRVSVAAVIGSVGLKFTNDKGVMMKVTAKDTKNIGFDATVGPGKITFTRE